MATKVISILDGTCGLLKNARREGESFSDVINHLLVKKENLPVYFGALKYEEVLERLGKDSRKMRKL